jgi:hypothetical protein
MSLQHGDGSKKFLQQLNMVNVSKNRALVRAQTAQLKLRGITGGPSESGGIVSY